MITVWNVAKRSIKSFS